MAAQQRPFHVLFLCTGNSARSIIAEAGRILTNRIRLFSSLPLAKLDRLSLSRKLGDIGKSAAPGDAAA